VTHQCLWLSIPTAQRASPLIASQSMHLANPSVQLQAPAPTHGVNGPTARTACAAGLVTAPSNARTTAPTSAQRRQRSVTSASLLTPQQWAQSSQHQPPTATVSTSCGDATTTPSAATKPAARSTTWTHAPALSMWMRRWAATTPACARTDTRETLLVIV